MCSSSQITADGELKKRLRWGWSEEEKRRYSGVTIHR
jgi:hypothetical protein